MTTVTFETVNLSFDSLDVEGLISRDMPETFEDKGTTFHRALEVVYTTEDEHVSSSVTHYQIARLIRACYAAEIQFRVLTDHNDSKFRSVVTIYLGS